MELDLKGESDSRCAEGYEKGKRQDCGRYTKTQPGMWRPQSHSVILMS